jgi:hypothetical protein
MYAFNSIILNLYTRWLVADDICNGLDELVS